MELFWTKRRDVDFAKSFSDAGANAMQVIMQNQGRMEDKNYTMDDFLLTEPFKLRSYCERCVVDDTDQHFVWRQVNGYRPKGIKPREQYHLII